MNELIAALQSFYQTLGISAQADAGDVGIGLTAILLLVLTLFKVLHRPPQLPPPTSPMERAETDGGIPQTTPIQDLQVESAETEAEAEVVPFPAKEPWNQRLKKGLSRSRQEIWGKLELVFSKEKSEFSKQQLESMEEILYGADLGPKVVAELMDALEQNVGKGFEVNTFKNFLYQFLHERMVNVQKKVDSSLYQFQPEAAAAQRTTKVIMIIGVNGAGKTTTIGKLATKLTRQGARVLVGACDTFRAAAVDQLQIWCERSGAEMVRAREGADPSGVAFEALQKAKNDQFDYCILDTAGRLHTKVNLMEELKKTKRVLSKLDETAPQQTLLVIDAITGQNALKQAREFHQALDVTGLVFTKCDGSSKAGNAVSIIQDLQIPIVYIGVGEEVEDLDTFKLEDYLKALLDMEKLEGEEVRS